MAIFEPIVIKDILQVTCSILHNNFFYSEENLNEFVDTFTYEIAQELDIYGICAEKEVIAELSENKLARHHFTCYFTSAYLRDYFINRFNFSEQELVAFENILPKYTGEKRYETKPRHKRTHN